MSRGGRGARPRLALPDLSRKAAPRLKIGFVFDDTLDAPDGVQQYITMLGRQFAARGNEVHYIVGDTHQAQNEPAFAFAAIHPMTRNVMVQANGNRMRIPLPASRRAIRALLLREKFDVLHIQAPWSPFMGGRVLEEAYALAAAGRIPRPKIVATYHIAVDSLPAKAGGFLLGRVINARAARLVDASLAVSTVAADYARRTAGVPARVVPNPVDAARMRSQAAGARMVPGRVVFLGRFVERKGVGVLLDALEWGEAHGTFPDGMSVVMAGKGPLLDEARARAAALTIPVELPGAVPEEDKAAFLASGQVAVFPATGAESFGIVLLEAMAAMGAAGDAVPNGADSAGAKESASIPGVVLAGDNPGYRSTMLGNEDALVDVTGPHCAEALARAIARALTDGAWAARLFDWEQRELLPRYDAPRVASQILGAYRSPGNWHRPR